jgi:hypothetical protein
MAWPLVATWGIQSKRDSFFVDVVTMEHLGQLKLGEAVLSINSRK